MCTHRPPYSFVPKHERWSIIHETNLFSAAKATENKLFLARIAYFQLFWLIKKILAESNYYFHQLPQKLSIFCVFMVGAENLFWQHLLSVAGSGL
jgi:hypothetical protein